MRGIGRRGHHEHVGDGRALAAPRPQQRPLLDAEAVLLVDHREPETRDGRVAVEQGVGADEHVARSRFQLGHQPAAFRGRRAVGEQARRHRALAGERSLGAHRETGQHREA